MEIAWLVCEERAPFGLTHGQAIYRPNALFLELAL